MYVYAFTQPIEKRDLAGVNSCCCCFSQGNAIMTLSARQRLLTFSEGNMLDLANLEVMVGIDNMSKRVSLLIENRR